MEIQDVHIIILLINIYVRLSDKWRRIYPRLKRCAETNIFKSPTSFTACLWKLIILNTNELRYIYISELQSELLVRIEIYRSYDHRAGFGTVLVSYNDLPSFSRDNCGKWLLRKQSDSADSFCQQIQLRYPVSSVTSSNPQRAGHPWSSQGNAVASCDTTIPTGPELSLAWEEAASQ